MGDHLKSKSHVDLLSYLSPKSQHDFLIKEQWKDLNINPKHSMKMIPSYHNIIKETQKSTYSNKEINKIRKQQDSRSKDCLKKLLFQNQQISRQCRQLSHKCAKLQKQNIELTQNYDEIKIKFIYLREAYDKLTDPLKLVSEKDNKKKQPQNTNILESILQKLSNGDNIKQDSNKNTNPINTQLSTPHLSLILQNNTNIKQIDQVARQQQKANKSNPSILIIQDIIDCSTQTQTQQNTDTQIDRIVKQFELKKQINIQRNIIQELQKKYNDVVQKKKNTSQLKKEKQSFKRLYDLLIQIVNQ